VERVEKELDRVEKERNSQPTATPSRAPTKSPGVDRVEKELDRVEKERNSQPNRTDVKTGKPGKTGGPAKGPAAAPSPQPATNPPSNLMKWGAILGNLLDVIQTMKEVKGPPNNADDLDKVNKAGEAMNDLADSIKDLRNKPGPSSGAPPGSPSAPNGSATPSGVGNSTEKGTPGKPSSDKASPDQTKADRPQADKARQHIEKVTKETLDKRGREMVVTSRYREDSAAHMRGAIDIRSKELSTEQRHAEAKEISKNLGKDYTVNVEEVDRPIGSQTNTSYRNGELLNRHENQPKTATDTHTHIQPDVPKK